MFEGVWIGGVQIKGQLDLSNSIVQGTMNIRNAKVSQNILLNETKVSQSAVISDVSSEGTIGANNAEFGSDLTLAQITALNLALEKSCIVGRTTLENIQLITGDRATLGAHSTKFQNGLKISNPATSTNRTDNPGAIRTTGHVESIHALRLPFYDNCYLVESVIGKGTEYKIKSSLWIKPSPLYFVGIGRERAHRFVELDGLSPPIHQVNADMKGPKLTKETVTDYLRFFCSNVWADKGWFRIVELKSLDDPHAQTKLSAEGKSKLAKARAAEKLLIPVLDKANTHWTIQAIVEYDAHLFHSTFKIHTNGFVEMTDDDLIGPSNFSKIFFDSPLRSASAAARHYLLSDQDEHSIENKAGRRDWPAEIKYDCAISEESTKWTLIKPQKGQSIRDALIESASNYNWLSPLFRGEKDGGLSKKKVDIDLREAYAKFLEDRDGDAWGDEVTIDLRGFTYEGLIEVDALPVTSGGQIAQRQPNGVKRAAPSSPLKDQKFGSSQTSLNKNAKKRKQWLDRVLKSNDKKSKQNNKGKFDQQPYAQLAAVLNRSGDASGAQYIVQEKVCKELIRWRYFVWDHRVTKIILALILFPAVALAAWGLVHGAPGFNLVAAALAATALAIPFLLPVWHGFFSFFFGYGLDPLRAIATVVFFVLLGTGLTAMANRSSIPGLVDFGTYTKEALPQILVKTPDIGTVSDVVRTDKDGQPLAIGLVTGGASAVATEAAAEAPTKIKDLPCGDNAVPLLYATDVFVPFLDLRQEEACTVANAYPGWQILKSVYAIFGWIVMSLMILTVTGVLRSRLEQ